jgi:hypothetical protein
METLGLLRFAVMNPVDMLLRTRLRSITFVREMFFWHLRRDMRKHSTLI